MWIADWRSRQAGMTMVELMVGLVVGLLILAAAGSVYLATNKNSIDSIRSAQLNMDLRGTMDVMVSEIRRAGYWGKPIGSTAVNPFMQSTADLKLIGTDCLLFAYDYSGDGAADSQDFYGFKKNGSAVSIRRGGTTSNADCGNGTWEGLTDADAVQVTQLQFTVAYQCENASITAAEATAAGIAKYGATACVAGADVYDDASSNANLIEKRVVTISLAGRHVKDSNLTMQLGETVEVRNARVQFKP